MPKQAKRKKSLRRRDVEKLENTSTTSAALVGDCAGGTCTAVSCIGASGCWQTSGCGTGSVCGTTDNLA